MPARYQKLGIEFQYPENWTLDESEALEGESTVSVFSPGGAFWTLVLHPSEIEPGDLVKAALRVMRKEYDNLDSEPVKEQVAGHKLIGYDLNFYCLDLTNTALLRAVRLPGATALILSQADDLEFEGIEPVLRAITRSLLSTAEAM